MKKAKLDPEKSFQSRSQKMDGKGIQNPTALATVIGREKYGKVHFQKLAAKGKKAAK